MGFAREALERARRAHGELERLQFLLGCSTRPRGGGVGPRAAGVAGDPTLSAVEWRTDERDDLARRMEACESDVVDAARLIEACRPLLSTSYPFAFDVVEMRYVDAMSWSDIAEEFRDRDDLPSTPRSTLRGWHDVALDVMERGVVEA